MLILHLKRLILVRRDNATSVLSRALHSCPVSRASLSRILRSRVISTVSLCRVFPVNSITLGFAGLAEHGERPEPLVHTENLVEVARASDIVLRELAFETYNGAEVPLFLV